MAYVTASSVIMFAAAAAAALSLAAMFAGGEACDNVATMTSAAACQNMDSWEKVCQQTLQGSPDSAAVTVYALTAARQAKLRYDETLAELDPLLGAGNAPTAERLAFDNCKEKYGAAASRMAAAVDQLSSCDFPLLRQEYIEAEDEVNSCLQGLQSYQFLPLFDRVAADHDSAMVAYLLGAIIVGK